MKNSYKKSNFGAAFFFLSKEQKEALSVIYDFCRMADDIVDDNPPRKASIQLANLVLEIEEVYGGIPKTGLGRELQKVVQEFEIPKKYPLILIEGVDRDLHVPVRYQTQEQLNWYMYRVASVVGLMCIEIFGYKNPASKKYAETLGYAVQLTNILRDIYEDAKINRIYLPLEDLQKFNVSEEDLLNFRLSDGVQKLFAFELDKAQKFYDEAREILPKEDFKTLLAARAMGAIYEAILLKLKKSPCLPREKKIKLSKLHKLLILFRTWRETK
ncbi:MAG: squalene/phytoene synthase family protein [Elusimicrobiaceae bacterium]|nr:squalene/phytoene synthase family protein [Elusimicrobiaceae bacterium]